MNPDISEFSYGYALTDELIHWHGTSLTAAPVFPSLFQEGQPGGGYDVMLQRPALPLFLQFKLSHCMIRENAREARDGLLTIPFYRMHIRPGRHSNQHGMLLSLEVAGNEVYYAAPAFHTPEDLNDAYVSHQVRSRSLWIRPSAIGPLRDDGFHHVSFKIPGPRIFCSEARPIDAKGDFEEFSHLIGTSFDRKARTGLSMEEISTLAHTVAEIARKRRDISAEAKDRSRTELLARHPLEQIAFYANVFMDCHFFLVRGKGGERHRPSHLGRGTDVES